MLLTGTAVVALRPMPEPDVWFHMALGREIVENHSFPKTDHFSFTAVGHEWISSGWGSSVLLYLVYKAAGVHGLLWLTFLVVLMGHLLLFMSATRLWSNSGSIVLLLLATSMCSMLRYTPRPELASQFCMAVLCLLLSWCVASVNQEEDSRRGRASQLRLNGKCLWLLPLLFVLWSNLHAGFVVGVAAVGIFAIWVTQQAITSGDRKLLAALYPCALCAVVWVINPYGYNLLKLPGKIDAIPFVREKIYEWKPLLATGPVQYPTAAVVGFLILLSSTGSAVWFSRLISPDRKIPWWNPALILFLAILAFYQRRHVAVVAFGISALSVPWLSGIDTKMMISRSRRQSFNFSILVLCLVMTVSLALLQHKGRFGVGRGLFKMSVDDNLMPVNATKWLQQNTPPAQVYNTYGAGGYLLFHLAPALNVFIDGRLDVYGHQVWLDYLAIESGELPLTEGADRYGLNTFVIYTRDAASNPEHLAFKLAADPQWRIVFFDDSYAVFSRVTPATATYAEKQGFQYANPYARGKFQSAVADPAQRVLAAQEVQRLLNLPGGGGRIAARLQEVLRSSNTIP